MELVDLKQLAKDSSLSIHTMRKFVRSGMPCFKVGRKYLVDPNEFEEWFTARFREGNGVSDRDLDRILDETIDSIV